MAESSELRKTRVPPYMIEVDGIEYPWTRRTITVPELRELAVISADIAILELDGDNEARRLEEDEELRQPGMMRYVATRRPLTAEGRGRLPRHWLLEGVPLNDLQPLLGAARETRYLVNDNLFMEGDPPDGLYLIVSGTVQVATTGENGETLLARVTTDDVLGEMGVLDGQARSGIATALQDTTAYFLPTEAFLDVLEGSTAVCLRMLVLLTQRLRVANGRLGELRATDSVPGAAARLGGSERGDVDGYHVRRPREN